MNSTLDKIENYQQYEQVKARVNELINEATEKGLLESDIDNEYTREIGKLSYLGAIYENENIEFKHLNIREKSPLIKTIEEEMYNRNIKQKELAEMLAVNEPTLSQIIRGKRKISMRLAQRLYKTLQIEPKIILEYA
jgi:antitoxin component HigA of HigAB toxin-antitoxin module